MKLAFDWQDFPLVTSEHTGTGGVIRTELEDFQVAEIPAYLPSGSGEHTYIRVEKRGHTTKFIMDELVRQLNLKFSDVGAAGLKDRHAVTTQWFSLPAKFEARLSNFEVPNAQILEVNRHENKLGIGHLRGNRFRIRVRGSVPDAAHLIAPIIETLRIKGVPNYFGPQRFGNTGGNAARGLELVLDKRMKGRESIPIKRFLIGSLQSLLFNHNVRLRLERGVYDAVLRGDVAKKHETGGVFIVEDSSLESPRAQALEISATAPLYGRKVMPAHLDAKALEDEVLALFDLNAHSFDARKGARRITRIKLEGTQIDPTEDGYWLAFDLPKGSFATVILREIMKTDVDAPEEESEQNE